MFDQDPGTVQVLAFEAGVNVGILEVVMSAGTPRRGGSVRFTDVQGNPIKGIHVTLEPDHAHSP